jgi:hypothetical protein
MDIQVAGHNVMPAIRLDPQDVWIAAVDQFLGSLDESDRRNLSSVSSVDDLLQHVESLHVSYQKARLTRILDRLRPVLRWLQSYNDCVRIYLEAAPKPLLILWGSLSLVIEVRLGYRPSLSFPFYSTQQVAGI